MTKIDWRATQRKIGAGVDGNPGRETYGKLFAAVAQHTYPSSVFVSLGDGAAAHFAAYGVTTIERVAGVIAECAHECGGFTVFEENLSYSAQGLAETWPSRYAINPSAKVKKPTAKAMSLARRPQDIANDTYALRMGNVSAADDIDASPDGWQYRGRGMLMLTGKANYQAMGNVLGLDLVRYPDLAADPGTSLLIAMQFMKAKGVFAAMDKGADQAERIAVNGGLIGFDDVQAIRKRAKGLLVPA